MKKSLLALAVLAASGAAMAQSSVTLFGVVDAGVTHISASGGQSVTGVNHSGNTASRLGFRGVEDLGGGVKANFWLEAGVAVDTGAGNYGGASGTGLEFKRRSTVGLAAGFGEIRLGRELNVGYSKPSSYDPFNQVGVAFVQGLSISADASRISNGVTYTSPNLAGFSAAVHYGFGEQAGNGKTGRYVGLMAAYDNGPLSVTLAADRLEAGAYAGATNGVANPVTGADRKGYSVGASYDLGVVKPAVIYHKHKETGADNDVIMLAATAPIGAGKLVASATRYDVKNTKADSNQFSLGYVYDLSKRTAVYGTASLMKNKNGAAKNVSGAAGVAVPVVAGKNVTGYQVGIRHSF